MPALAQEKKILWHFLPFWLFLALFKFAGSLHYSLLSPLGARLLPVWLVGLIIGGGSVVQLLLDVPVGRLMDRRGYVRFLLFGTAAFLLAGVAWMFRFTTFAYAASFVLSTAGWQFFGPGVNAYVLSQAPDGRAATFISFRDVFESLGVVVASAVLGFVLSTSTSAMGFIVADGMLLGILALLFAPRGTRNVQTRRQLATHDFFAGRHALGTVLAALRRLNPASTMLLISTFASSTFYGVVWFVVPLVIAGEAHAGILGFGLGVFDFAIVALGFLLGSLADRGNKRALVFFGLLLFSVSGVVLGFHFDWLFLIFGFLATAGDEMASISLWSWMHALDRTHVEDGTVSGAINLFDDLGWAVGPILAGILYGAIGASWTIVSAAALIFAGWIAYQFLMHAHVPVPAGADVPAMPRRARHKR